MPTRIKYAFILRLQDEKILTKASAGKIKKYQSEAGKIRSKILISALKPDERKKITSPSHGKWLSLCDDSKIIYVVCVPTKYSEKLANQFLDVIHSINKFQRSVEYNFPNQSQAKNRLMKEK